MLQRLRSGGGQLRSHASTHRVPTEATLPATGIVAGEGIAERDDPIGEREETLRDCPRRGAAGAICASPGTARTVRAAGATRTTGATGATGATRAHLELLATRRGWRGVASRRNGGKIEVQVREGARIEEARRLTIANRRRVVRQLLGCHWGRAAAPAPATFFAPLKFIFKVATRAAGAVVCTQARAGTSGRALALLRMRS